MKEKQYDEMMAEYIAEGKKYRKEESKLKNGYKKQLRGLINVSGLFRNLDENDNWYPIGIFSIEETDYKSHHYPNHVFAKIIDDESDGEKWNQYMKTIDSEIRGIDHYYVIQWTTGMEGDSFSGYLLYPLKNGKYFKVSYSC